MLALGIILLVVGVVLAALSRRQQGHVRELRAAQRSSTRELAALADSVGQALVEAGNYRQLVEVVGTIRCDAPLTSEIGQQPCVYYDARVSRVYEDTRHRGHHHARHRASGVRRGSETMSRNSQRVPFWVEDAAGRILVEPTGAQIEPVQSVDRFDAAEAATLSGTLKIGSFSLTVSGFGDKRERGRRTLGYRLWERTLPVGRRVYVVGEATDASGELAIERPRDKGRFIISTRSKEEIIRSVRARAQWLLAGGAASGGVGLLLATLGALGV